MNDPKRQSDVAQRLAGLSAEKRALLEKRLRQPVKSAPADGREPLAIIGMACRFPGGADTPDSFWKLLMDGYDGISTIPAERRTWTRLQESGLGSQQIETLRWGGFVNDIASFDPAFFNISPREADHMDPQQRLLLMTAVEALEAAGIPLPELSGRPVGVYVGIHSMSSDYFWLQGTRWDGIDTYTSTGVAHSIVANRLSYSLDLRGPSLAVDTACSSSLVAVHMACQSLRAGECDLAVAGGVNLILIPETSVSFSKLNFLAPDGRCKVFDARADGFVRSEGCGVLVLKQLSRAQADNDPILSVVRGSAVNQDGASNGLTAPNGASQQAVIAAALRNGSVHPEEVSFIETHGTGTALGDPIEVEAIDSAYGSRSGEAAPCYLGAGKSNIGHLEAAAGVAGLIKTVLCLRHRMIPPNIHFSKLNPNIVLNDTRLRIPTEAVSWEANSNVRIGAVSSFGFGGTNAHVILQEYVAEAAVTGKPNAPVSSSRNVFLLPLSAKSPTALKAMITRWQHYLGEDTASDEPLNNICYTAGVRRTHNKFRATFTGRTKGELVEKLQHVLGTESFETAAGTKTGHLVFVFSGQGSQWFGMGKELFEREPVYRDMVERIDHLLKPLAQWSIVEALGADEAQTRLDKSEVAQPAIFAVQIGLVALWESWGIRPEAVVGYGMGEVAAAHCSGVLSLEDAVRVIYHRGRILQRTQGKAMAASVGLTPQEADALIANYAGRVTIAAVNSPTSVILTGEPESLRNLLQTLEVNRAYERIPNGDYVLHGPPAQAYATEMIQAVKDLQRETPTIRLVSTVSGNLGAQGDFGPHYWGRNIGEPIRFAAAIKWLIANAYNTFMEISPQPTLLSHISQNLSAEKVDGKTVATLQCRQDGLQSLMETAGELYTVGHALNWRVFYPRPARLAKLPPYPWDLKRHWIDDQDWKQEGNDHSDRKGKARTTAASGPSEHAERFYSLVWRRRDLVKAPAERQFVHPAGWLVFDDRQGVGDQLRERLLAAGHACYMVQAGEHFEVLGNDRFTVNPTSSKDFGQLIQTIARECKIQLHGAIHLWSLSSSEALYADGERIEAVAKRNCGSVLLLQKYLAAQPKLATARIWLVTAGAQPVENGPVSLAVAQAPLWGFGRVVALDSPHVFGGLLDLDPDMEPEFSAQRLYNEIAYADGEEQIAVRGPHRFVARLINQRPLRGEAGTCQFKRKASYLITGGLGRIGLKLAQWMAKQGAGHLVLLGRRCPAIKGGAPTDGISDADDSKIATIKALQQAGTQVHVVSADVGNLQQMTSLFERFGHDLPPLRGLVHAAGVITPTPLEKLNIDTLASVFEAKIRGTWFLHELSRSCNLDFFVLFSSAASILGAKDLAHYAAANQFLDAFAHYGRCKGQPVLSINWGWWAGGWKDDQLVRHFNQAGLHALNDEDGMAALGELLAGESVQSMYADIDWPQLAPVYEAKKKRPFLNEICRAAKAVSSKRDTAHSLRDDLQTALPDGRFKILRDFIRKKSASLLGFKDPFDLDVKAGFFKIGMDSIMAVELQNCIEAATGLKLPATVAFDYPTIVALAGYVVDLISEPSPADATGVGKAPSAANINPANVDPGYLFDRGKLSENELIDLLSEKLSEVGRLDQ